MKLVEGLEIEGGEGCDGVCAAEVETGFETETSLPSKNRYIWFSVVLLKMFLSQKSHKIFLKTTS